MSVLIVKGADIAELYIVTLNIFYCSIRNNWVGHKFHNLDTM